MFKYTSPSPSARKSFEAVQCPAGVDEKSPATSPRLAERDWFLPRIASEAESRSVEAGFGSSPVKPRCLAKARRNVVQSDPGRRRSAASANEKRASLVGSLFSITTSNLHVDGVSSVLARYREVPSTVTPKSARWNAPGPIWASSSPLTQMRPLPPRATVLGSSRKQESRRSTE